MEPCKPGSLVYTNEEGDSPPRYDVGSFKDSVLNCFIKVVKGKSLDELMKGLKDEDVKRLFRTLAEVGEEGLRDYLKSATDDAQGVYSLQYNCHEKNLEVQIMFSTVLHTPDANIAVTVPISKKLPCDVPSIFHWQKGVHAMCDCCDEPNAN